MVIPKRSRSRGKTSADGVPAARPANQQAGGGAIPTSALHDLRVAPVPFRVARHIVSKWHYLHSMPGGTQLAFGVFREDSRLLGALTLGAGPSNAHRLVDRATPDDCLTLTRLWLADELPRNAESRVLGVVARALQRHTDVKFLLSYADPSQGHLGVIYQASNWLYTGLSAAMPLYDLGDGVPRHSRSLSHAYGTHSLRHFLQHGVPIVTVPQARKHRYVLFLDPAWQARLCVPMLPYPKQEVSGESH